MRQKLGKERERQKLVKGERGVERRKERRLGKQRGKGQGRRMGIECIIFLMELTVYLIVYKKPVILVLRQPFSKIPHILYSSNTPLIIQAVSRAKMN